jgi:hypothetical protein
MTQLANQERRLDRIEGEMAETRLAIAELTRWHKGDWQPPAALRSAAGRILCEQRALELERQSEREEAMV